MNLKLSERDKLIIAYALVMCPGAELGDRIGGHDGHTYRRRLKLAAMFNADVVKEQQESIANYHTRQT